MLKKLLFLSLSLSLLLIVPGTSGLAQHYLPPLTTGSGNPGSLNKGSEWPVNGGLANGWTMTLEGNPTSPTWSDIIDLPIDFEFAGQKVTQYKVSSTGILTFDVDTGQDPPTAVSEKLPSSKLPDQSVAIWGIRAEFDQNTGNQQITSNIVRRTFGSTPNRQHWVFFAAYVLDSWSFWSIVLEESTNKIYIVDQRHGSTATSYLTLGVQIDGSNATMVPGSPTLSPLAGASEKADDNVYYTFEYGDVKAYDIMALEISNHPYLSLEEGQVMIEGKILNMGTETINSFGLSYYAGNSYQSTTIDNVSIKMFETYTFTHPVPWALEETGSFDTYIFLTEPNGQTDENVDNDAISKIIQVADPADLVQQKTLHEVFTSATCPPCKPGNENLDPILEANEEKVVTVKYQMDWPGSGDIYFTAEGGVRKSYYAVNSVPMMFVNGAGPMGPGNYTQAALNDFYDNKKAFIKIDAKYDVDVLTRKVEVNVELMPALNFNKDINENEDLRLHVIVVENTTYDNVATNGETEFYHVMKKMLPDAEGTLLNDLEKGKLYEEKFSYTFPVSNTVEEFDDLSFIAFIQDNNNKNVFNAVWAYHKDSIPPETTGINPELYHQNGFIALFPNPSEDDLFVKFHLGNAHKVQLALYNVLGEKVLVSDKGRLTVGDYTEHIKTENLPSGIYLLQLSADNMTYQRKIRVIK